MPLYVYRCRSCGERFETLMRLGANEIPPCPTCGARDAQRWVSTVARVASGCEPAGGA